MPRNSQDFNAPVTAIGEELPSQFELLDNYPNPFNPSTTIEFSAGNTDRYSLRLDILDINGRLVATLINGIPHTNKIVWNGQNSQGHLMPAGVYFARLTSASASRIQKMILLK